MIKIYAIQVFCFNVLNGLQHVKCVTEKVRVLAEFICLLTRFPYHLNQCGRRIGFKRVGMGKQWIIVVLPPCLFRKPLCKQNLKLDLPGFGGETFTL